MFLCCLVFCFIVLMYCLWLKRILDVLKLIVWMGGGFLFLIVFEMLFDLLG